jgi:hypothetical protein
MVRGNSTRSEMNTRKMRIRQITIRTIQLDKIFSDFLGGRYLRFGMIKSGKD